MLELISVLLAIPGAIVAMNELIQRYVAARSRV